MSKPDMLPLFPVPPGEGKGHQAQPKREARIDLNEVDLIEEMAGALTDPIIAFPSSWMDTIPQPLKDRVPLERLAHHMRCLKGQACWDEATDLEALIYIYPASLEYPLPEQWTRIYLYLGTVCLGEKFPQDIRREALSDYDMAELRELKRWIQKRKLQARRERKTQQKQGKKQDRVKPTLYEPMRLF